MKKHKNPIKQVVIFKRFTISVVMLSPAIVYLILLILF